MPAPVGIVASQRSVTAWSPASLSNLAAWYDADHAASFTYSSGVVVSQWNDRSGNSRHLVQGTVGSQPSRNGTQNGRATVVFDGTADHLLRSGVITTSVDNITMFAACHRTGGNSGSCVVFANGNIGGNGYGIALRANGSNIGCLRGGVSWDASSTADPAAPGVLALRRTSGTWSLHLNGTATNLAVTGAPATPNELTYLPSLNHLFGGPVYEAIFYDTALSDADRGLVEDYLADKWGTP